MSDITPLILADTLEDLRRSSVKKFTSLKCKELSDDDDALVEARELVLEEALDLERCAMAVNRCAPNYLP